MPYIKEEKVLQNQSCNEGIKSKHDFHMKMGWFHQRFIEVQSFVSICQIKTVLKNILQDIKRILVYMEYKIQ